MSLFVGISGNFYILEKFEDFRALSEVLKACLPG